MTVLESGTHNDLIAEEVELKLDHDCLDISQMARERDETLGSPNFISNFLVPLLVAIFRRGLAPDAAGERKPPDSAQVPAA